MIISLGGGYTAEWHGGHYIYYVTPHGHAHNAFSFDWEENSISQLDALEAFIAHEILLSEEGII